MVGAYEVGGVKEKHRVARPALKPNGSYSHCRPFWPPIFIQDDVMMGQHGLTTPLGLEKAITPLSRQLGNQRLGLLQVRGIKAFSEPSVDVGQELVGCLAFALTLPELTQTDGCP